MSKEAEISGTCISCHDTHLCQNQAHQGGLCISSASVLQEVTLNMIPYKRIMRQKSLATGVKLAIACQGKLSGVGVIAHAKSPKMALPMRS